MGVLGMKILIRRQQKTVTWKYLNGLEILYKFYKKENYPITSTLLFDEINIEQIYNDLDESTEKLKNYVPIISDIKNNINCIKKSKEKTK
jgi:hypothetical protein